MEALGNGIGKNQAAITVGEGLSCPQERVTCSLCSLAVPPVGHPVGHPVVYPVGCSYGEFVLLLEVDAMAAFCKALVALVSMRSRAEANADLSFDE